jgi:hypothetical protein
MNTAKEHMSKIAENMNLLQFFKPKAFAVDKNMVVTH